MWLLVKYKSTDIGRKVAETEIRLIDQVQSVMFLFYLMGKGNYYNIQYRE